MRIKKKTQLLSYSSFSALYKLRIDRILINLDFLGKLLAAEDSTKVAAARNSPKQPIIYFCDFREKNQVIAETVI